MFAAGVAVASTGWRLDPEFARDVDVVLTTTAAALLLAAVVFFLLRARHKARQAGIGMATGALMLSVVTLGTAELTPLVSDPPNLPIAGLREWSILGVLACFSFGVSDVRGERNRRALMMAPALVLLAATGGALLPGQGLAPPMVLLVAGWLAVATAHGYSFVVTGDRHRVWIAIGLCGLMLGDIARSAAAAPELWGITAGVVRVTGMLMMLGGLVGELELSQWRQRQQLDSNEALMTELHAMTDAAQRALEERDHEARSALAAIEYTAQALRRRGSQVRPQEIEQLELAMVTEVALLRRLITATDAVAETEPFDVAAALEGVLVAEAVAGLEVEWRIPAGLLAMGSPPATAEIVQCLLDNARRHALGAPVGLTAGQRGPFVIVQVDDDGPGVPPERRQAIFKRGRDAGHPTSAQGRGLGLFIASRLAREQRGQLWVQESASGGASFRLALRAVADAPQQVLDVEFVHQTGGEAGRPAREEG